MKQGAIVKIREDWGGDSSLYVVTEWNGDRGFVYPVEWNHGLIVPQELVRIEMIQEAE